MNKRLGIIGGMGPKATAVFFNQIVDHTVAASDAEHIDMVILNNTKIPDRTAAILSGNHQPVLDELLSSVRQLESLGVDHIAIPCNTACFFADKLQQATNVPIINIVEETVKYIKELPQEDDRGKVVVGVLATDGTIYSGTYLQALEHHGLECIIPQKEIQVKVVDLIYNQVKKTGRGNLHDFEYLVGEMVKSGCDYVVLGCTELSWFAANYTLPSCCIDALGVLTKVCIERSGKGYKE